MSYYDIKEIHCPVDYYIIKLSESLVPKISSYLNDSEIYCISLLFGFLSGYSIGKRIKILPGLFFMLSYAFNIVYNYHVQKYKKQSYMNNYLFTLFTYIYILYTLYNRNKYAFIIVSILIIPTICNWGCQIKYIKSKYPDSFDIPIFNEMCKILCPFYKEQHKRYNIFGNGSLMLLISIYLAYL
jgi:hypothetical protein